MYKLTHSFISGNKNSKLNISIHTVHCISVLNDTELTDDNEKLKYKRIVKERVLIILGNPTAYVGYREC